MFPDHWRNLVQTDLARLLHKPLIAVIVLGRAHGHMQPVRMPSPVVSLLKNHGFHTLRTV